MNNELHPKLLRHLLRYELDTGKLFWHERTPDMFVDGKRAAEHKCASWNARYAGNMAFTAHDSNGYMTGCIFGIKYFAHRVIWAIVNDEWPDQVDHINGIPSDNRIGNLRSVSHAENLRNQKRQSRNTSGVCGVSLDKDGKWRARITIGGKRINLGRYINFNEAVVARKTAEIKYGFHANHGRE